MLNWIRRRWRERRRAIFCYWDGARRRRIDPLIAYRKLTTHPRFDPESHLTLIDADTVSPVGPGREFALNAALEAFDITLDATREVFGVSEWSEDRPGLTQAETRDLLKSFLIYCIDLKKNGSDTPIGREPTVSSQSYENSRSISASLD